jgi:hypothetical protein
MKMTKKLRDIFDSLFGITKPPEEKGEDPSKKKNKGNIKFNPENPEVKLNNDLTIKVHVTKRDGSSADNVVVQAAIKDNTIVQIKTADTKTDFAGVANIVVTGIKLNETILTVTATINEEIDNETVSTDVTENVVIKVIP